MIGYKKVYYTKKDGTTGDAVLKLVIPIAAKVVKPIHSNKFRASEVMVAEAWQYIPCFYDCGKFVNSYLREFKNAEKIEFYSGHDNKFKYRVGELVSPDKFSPNLIIECTHGIHFFATRNEAKNW